MVKLKNRKIFVMIVLLIVISSTIAYLYSTDTFQNIFVAASYKVVVTEEFISPDNWTPGDETDKTVTLKNEGTVPIKVRVKLEEEWKDSNGEYLPLIHNGENVSIINFDNLDDYIYKDGYYYYDPVLNPGETTSSILKSVTFNPNYSGTITCEYLDDYTESCSSSNDGYEGGTYKLTITIEGVQEDYYVEAWNLSGPVQHQYLYDVLKNESESNGLARKYTGEHHDSFTEDPSKDIYHWYASTNSEGTQVLDKNNVVFGEHCWQMIRTTDTGGVKMIYNGEVEDDKCLSTRGTHIGYSSSVLQVLNRNYWYGTEYTYDSDSSLFSLAGEKEQVRWNATTWPELIGKYTCISANEFGTCSTLYFIDKYVNDSTADTIPLSLASHYSQFGGTTFAPKTDSPTFAGYKYGDIYSYSTVQENFTQNLANLNILFSASNLSLSFWFSDSISYNSSTGKYSLNNPFQVSSEADYPSLVGKYTLVNSNSNAESGSAYYIAGVYNTRMMDHLALRDGKLLSDYEPIITGDSIVDNGNGTYTLNNTSSVTLTDWRINYANYKNKYICINSNTCADPWYITDTSTSYFYYVGGKIALGKSRNGLNLIDTLLVRRDELRLNSSNYSDYKYTCNTDSTTCLETDLRRITSYSTTEYNYVPNRYYGNSVTWDGTNYTLVDTIDLDDFNINNISSHHYMCVSSGLKTCQTVAYVYYYSGAGPIYYIKLNDGVSSVSKVLEDMFAKNTTDSIIKLGIDAWYKHYLLENYDDYLEDTIFCNDRSIRSLGGWDDNGGMTNVNLQFKENTVTSDLSCTNITDQFSVSNNNAPLTYKVGLMSSPEMNILGNNNARKTGQDYWLASPSYFDSQYVFGRALAANGNMISKTLLTYSGLRPAISLKPGIEYSSGDGSMANPYIVDTD